MDNFAVNILIMLDVFSNLKVFVSGNKTVINTYACYGHNFTTIECINGTGIHISSAVYGFSGCPAPRTCCPKDTDCTYNRTISPASQDSYNKTLTECEGYQSCTPPETAGRTHRRSGQCGSGYADYVSIDYTCESLDFFTTSFIPTTTELDTSNDYGISTTATVIESLTENVDKSTEGQPKGVIIGVALGVGALLILVLLVVIIVCVRRKSKKKARANGHLEDNPSNGLPLNGISGQHNTTISPEDGSRPESQANSAHYPMESAVDMVTVPEGVYHLSSRRQQQLREQSGSKSSNGTAARGLKGSEKESEAVIAKLQVNSVADDAETKTPLKDVKKPKQNMAADYTKDAKNIKENGKECKYKKNKGEKNVEIETALYSVVNKPKTSNKKTTTQNVQAEKTSDKDNKHNESKESDNEALFYSVVNKPKKTEPYVGGNADDGKGHQDAAADNAHESTNPPVYSVVDRSNKGKRAQVISDMLLAENDQYATVP